MNKPIVSVIVPVYNSEKYLEKCIESILNQSIKDLELILIDDGSIDESGIVCERYALLDNRVKVIHKKNEGPAKARNIGINISAGEYIGFVDSDDYIEKDMYIELYRSAQMFNSDMVICGYIELSKGNKEIYPPLRCNQKLDRQYIENVLIRKIAESEDLGLYSMINKLFKRKFIIDNKILLNERINFAEDWFFIMDVLEKAKYISGIEKCLYMYMCQSTGLYSKFRYDFCEINNMMRKRLLQLFIHYGVTKEEYFKRDMRYFNDDIRYMVKCADKSKDAKLLVRKVLDDDELKKVSKQILKLDKSSLSKSQLSRKNKILPFIICYFKSMTYFLLKCKGMRNKLLDFSDIK